MGMLNKAKLEQYGFVGLVLVFGLVLFHSLGRSGILKGGAKALMPSMHHEQVAGSLPNAVKKYWDQFDPNNLSGTDVKPAHAASVTPGSGYAAQALRDPFRDLLPKAPPKPEPPAVSTMKTIPDVQQAAPVSLPPFSLTGVWWGEQPRALINGNIYHVGDTVDGATITRIAAEGVTVEFGGSRFVLTTASEPDAGRWPKQNVRRR